MPRKKLSLCALPSCHGERFDLVHKFPMEKSRVSAWLEALKIPELCNMPLDQLRRTHFICSRHFRKEDYKHNFSRHLNTTAVPSNNYNKSEIMPNANINTIKDTSCQEVSSEVNKNTVDIPIIHEFETNTLQGSSESVYCQQNEQLCLKQTKEILLQREECNEQILNDNEENVLKQTNESSIVQDELVKEYKTSETSQLENMQDKLVQKKIELKPSFLQLNHSAFSEPLLLNIIWLREQCKCENCYDKISRQFLCNILNLPYDIRVKEMVSQNGSDGHLSRFKLKELYRSQMLPYSNINIANSKKVLWNAEKIKNLKFAEVIFTEYLVDDVVASRVIDSIIRYGFSIIDNVPPNEMMTDILVRRLFPIQKSNCGSIFKVESCNRNLLDIPQTESTYLEVTPGLKVLHCIKNIDKILKIHLVDGFKILNQLKINEFEAYKRLTETLLPFEKIIEGKHYKCYAPVIEKNKFTNDFEKIRFNLSERSFLDTVSQTKVLTIYSDLRLLTKEIQTESNCFSFELVPGRALLIDNWRILQGWKNISCSHQILSYCISRSDFEAKARFFKLID